MLPYLQDFVQQSYECKNEEDDVISEDIWDLLAGVNGSDDEEEGPTCCSITISSSTSTTTTSNSNSSNSRRSSTISRPPRFITNQRTNELSSNTILQKRGQCHKTIPPRNNSFEKRTSQLPKLDPPNSKYTTR